MARAAAALLLLGVLLPAASPAKSLPKYVKPCRRSDPNFDACALRNGIAAVPGFINGDRKYNVPPLVPLKIPQVVVKQPGGLNFDWRDLSIYGLDNSDIKKVNCNFDKKVVTVEFLMPRCTMLADYETEGRILVVPIQGKGKANVTLDNLYITMRFYYDTIKKSDGKEYMTAKDFDLDYNTTRAYINMENLFNGDKILGDNINKFLDENWRDVVRDIGPSLTNALGRVIMYILDGIMKDVPYDEAFPA